MYKITLDRVLDVTIAGAIAFILLCLCMLIVSCIKYYSAIPEAQQAEVIAIQQEFPEIKPIVQDMQRDNIITKQEYDYLITVSNEIRTKKRPFGN